MAVTVTESAWPSVKPAVVGDFFPKAGASLTVSGMVAVTGVAPLASVADTWTD